MSATTASACRQRSCWLAQSQVCACLAPAFLGGFFAVGPGAAAAADCFASCDQLPSSGVCHQMAEQLHHVTHCAASHMLRQQPCQPESWVSDKPCPDLYGRK